MESFPSEPTKILSFLINFVFFLATTTANIHVNIIHFSSSNCMGLSRLMALEERTASWY